jgi:hypothetical protein
MKEHAWFAVQDQLTARTLHRSRAQHFVADRYKVAYGGASSPLILPKGSIIMGKLGNSSVTCTQRGEVIPAEEPRQLTESPNGAVLLQIARGSLLDNRGRAETDTLSTFAHQA